MRRAAATLAVAACAALAVACGRGGGGGTGADAGAATSAGAGAAPGASVSADSMTHEQYVAKLAAADAADGTTDRVISSCVPCGMSMPGSPQHAVQAEGYTFHLCSESCRKTVEADPKRAIAQLEAAR